MFCEALDGIPLDTGARKILCFNHCISCRLLVRHPGAMIFLLERLLHGDNGGSSKKAVKSVQHIMRHEYDGQLGLWEANRAHGIKRVVLLRRRPGQDSAYLKLIRIQVGGRASFADRI